MKYAKEELVKVTSFDELKPGMIVVAHGCEVCGRDHVDLLTELYFNEGCIDCGMEPCWSTIELSGHDDDDMANCFACDISKGELFRLDTGIDEAADLNQQLADNLHARGRFLARLTR